MFAIIDNKPIKVKMVNRNYDVNRVEVEIIEGQFKGYKCIVSIENIREEVTSDTRKVRIFAKGIYYGKEAAGLNENKLRVNKAGNIECYVWSPSKGVMILKVYKPWEVSAL